MQLHWSRTIAKPSASLDYQSSGSQRGGRSQYRERICLANGRRSLKPMTFDDGFRSYPAQADVRRRLVMAGDSAPATSTSATCKLTDTVDLPAMLDDVKYWADHQTFAPDEIAVDCIQLRESIRFKPGAMRADGGFAHSTARWPAIAGSGIRAFDCERYSSARRWLTITDHLDRRLSIRAVVRQRAAERVDIAVTMTGIQIGANAIPDDIRTLLACRFAGNLITASIAA